MGKWEGTEIRGRRVFYQKIQAARGIPHERYQSSRLKAQLTKFCSELCVGLSKPLTGFVSQMVRDGSTGELHLGYWRCDVTAAEVDGSEIAPLYQKLFSVEAKEFHSENAEILAAVDWIRTHTQGRRIWAIDRGGDRKKLLEPLLDRGEHFVIRSTGKRTVIGRRKLRGSAAEVAGRRRLRHQARILKIEDGQEKTYDLRYGAEPLELPGRAAKLWLVVIAGFGDQPMMLLANLEIAARDSQSLWRIVQIYLARWEIGVSSQFHG